MNWSTAFEIFRLVGGLAFSMLAVNHYFNGRIDKAIFWAILLIGTTQR